jgi:uncharacterized protein YbjQ (UPF0145 family)
MKCKYCQKDSRDWFLVFPLRDHWCADCGSHLCSDHRIPTYQANMDDSGYSKPMDLCEECKTERERKANSITAVRGNHVGNHNIVENLFYLETTYEHDDFEKAIWELKFNAFLKGANGIINLKTVPHQHSDGNYIFKKWTACGDLVVVEENNF